MRTYSATLQLRAASLATASLFLYSCDAGNSTGLQDADAYSAELATWKEGRVSRLKGPDGYLNRVGLFWMRRDVNTMGASPGSDFVLPGNGPAMLGRWDHTDHGKQD